MTFKLFGNQGYLTADPKNVESILSTNFEGMYPILIFATFLSYTQKIGASAPDDLVSCLCWAKAFSLKTVVHGSIQESYSAANSYEFTGKIPRFSMNT